MKKHPFIRLMVLAGFLGTTGCALGTGDTSLDDAESDGNAPSETVATAAQPLLDDAQAQAFGPDFGTPDFGSGSTALGTAMATGDLDGDGTDDLVVGVPLASDGALIGAGAVRIFSGQHHFGATFGGLSNSHVIQLHQPGAGNPETDDRFGSAVAVGDFDCDGHLDLAVGAPYDDQSLQGGGVLLDAGNVSIFYGPAFTSWQLFWQGSAGIPGLAEYGDHFGAVLAAGNFNGDTANGHACSDLAIGAPFEAVGPAWQAGSVTILYGRSTGLNTAGAPAPQLWHQNVGSVFGVAEDYDLFGSALATGDFNNDGKDDLAIGVPQERYPASTVNYVGLVQVLKGASGGLTDTGNYALELADFAGLSTQNAKMGSSLARGDFDDDGDDDLAVGTPSLSSGGVLRAGGVLIYRQSGGTLAAALRYDQDSAIIPGMAEHEDNCGSSLAAGDFNGDGQDDLANGCPNEIVTANGAAEGALNTVYFGFVSGAFAVTQAQLWHKNTAGIPDQCSSEDLFSSTLAAGDFNGDGRTDLSANAAPTSFQGGTVNVIYGAP